MTNLRQVNNDGQESAQEAEESSYFISLLKITKDIGIAGFGELFYGIVVYAINLIISRFLGAEGVGIYAQAVTVVMLALLIARSGFEGGILRFVSSYLVKQDYARLRGLVSFSTWSVLAMSAFLGGSLFFGSPLLAHKVFNEPQLASVLRMFALTVPFSALTGIWLSNIQAFQYIKHRVFLERIFLPLVTISTITLFLLLGWKWTGVISGTILAAVTGSFFSYYIYRTLYNSLVQTTNNVQFEVRTWIDFSFPLLLSGILAFTVARMATLLLGFFRPSAEVGIYEIALKITLLIELPVGVSNLVFAPMIGEMYTQGNITKLHTLFKSVTKWVFTASFLIFLIAVFLARPILAIFGPEFIAGISVLFVLSFSQLVNASTGAVGWILIMSGYSRLHLVNSTLSALATIMLGLLLIPHYGMTGAAVAVGGVQALVNLLRLVQVFYLFKIHPYRWDFTKPLISGLMTIGGIYLLQEQMNCKAYSTFWCHLLLAGCIVLLFVTFLLLLKLQQEEKELLNWAFKKINISLLS